MNSISLVFPHQLFRENPCLNRKRKVYLIEEFLFFRQYRFHRQKLIFHRASMRFYRDHLIREHYDVEYIDSVDPHSDIRTFVDRLGDKGVREVHFVDVVDDWLDKRLTANLKRKGIKIKKYASPMFLNDAADLEDYFRNRKSFFQTKFYIHQRRRLNILLSDDDKPEGGKWSFDSENRLTYPDDQQPPSILFPVETPYLRQAKSYVGKHFNENPGALNSWMIYPVTFEQAGDWLDQFIRSRLNRFGDYEDALTERWHILNHSVLSPILNAGLITPGEVVQAVLDFAESHDVPLNSLEGFIRQVIGWREFMRAVYVLEGGRERSRNFWGFERKIPPRFWEASTGVRPFDIVSKKVLKTAYAHHIERLMVLGNFMLLCEFDPDEVYRWFMELFIDAYDWVMVPNVYGMSQFADGGLFATKPYISSSNYLLKMGDFGKGEWQSVWDALFWRFMHVHRDFFLENPRMSMLVRTFDRMKASRQQDLLKAADKFMDKL